MNNTLIILCGIPGSGKSTYAKKLLKLHPEWEYVSRDEVRYEYVTDQAHYFDHEYDVYKEFCNRIMMHLINGKTVIADATHLNKKSRDTLLKNLTVDITTKIALVIQTPLNVCLERNAKRVGITRVPDKTLYSMYHSFRTPSITEEFDKVIYVKGV